MTKAKCSECGSEESVKIMFGDDDKEFPMCSCCLGAISCEDDYDAVVRRAEAGHAQ